MNKNQRTHEHEPTDGEGFVAPGEHSNEGGLGLEAHLPNQDTTLVDQTAKKPEFSVEKSQTHSTAFEGATPIENTVKENSDPWGQWPDKL
jgi:hypothetical protein